MKKSLLVIYCFLNFTLAFPQVAEYTINGEHADLQRYQIVLPVSPIAAETKAANELQKYLEKITGIKLPIVSETSKLKTGEFVIGLTNRAVDIDEISSLGPDEFILQTAGKKITIAGGSHKGALYGVYELLEKYLDCRFWAPGTESIPTKSSFSIPSLQVREKPAFESREVHYAGMDEQDFTDKMRCDWHAWQRAGDWGLWVHTMFTLVPPEKYFDTHPEYFALMGGKRTKTQLCLSNPDVLKITIVELGKLMKVQPEKKYWSVSQMDTYGYCECDGCTRLPATLHSDSALLNPSEPMITFINQVAAAFPDKVISTLAYQYSRKAPENVKPAANVNIMLCTIECDRSRPLEADTSAGSFVHDLREWAAISSDILIWDYAIQFTNMIAPFPNLSVLKPNLEFFKKNNVRAVFEQGCHGTYSENQELRQYLLAKLLWNPYLNIDSLTNQFLEGYYGAAGIHIGNYLNLMEVALQESKERLWIYSSPMEETNSFLSPANIEAYNQLFNLAEASVAHDPELTMRVNKARLPLRYAIIEIAKKNITGPDGFLEPSGNNMLIRKDITNELDLFVDQSNRYGVKTIHEQKLSPDDYKTSTLQFFSNAYTSHLAKGKPYSLAVNPGQNYLAEGDHSLTDGKRGSPNYFVLWQGFEGVDFSAVIDLGRQTEFNYVGAEFLQNLASWIFYPRELKVSISDDGTVFREIAMFDSLSSADPLLIREQGKKVETVKAKYVKFDAKAQKTCPDWHIGHGGKAWLFVDELIVDYREK